MKSILTSLFSIGLATFLTACGGNSAMKRDVVQELSADAKIAHFEKGDFGEVTLTKDYVIPADAVFIDIRNAWERKVNPKGSVHATYQVRVQGANGKEDKTIARKLNENFVNDVLKLPAVANDRDTHIILICASGSRSGAHGNKAKESAAKLLSDNGFTYVEHIKKGMWDTGWMALSLPYSEL